eukprot:CAMPEP_0197625140 /NCGR_PEP_ID=MMETSP1338-20131121/4577_1 /TAXON_ID=43686 ORGANISM="Pelagodinium beii, Strain RCC1491" /NCGR_SAMPLE_ID=MMETSP1338 /ASSEMBLY_ACC=CAM_ASM_000754 /LENGTH=181 /DNA_ID=CAMNT_0043195459 /DNA_START=66 /DNA_END=611 /DNA_ORIENTATION=-
MSIASPNQCRSIDYENYVAEFEAAGELGDIPGLAGLPKTDGCEALRLACAWQLETDLPSGWIPSTTLFLKQDDETIIGVVNVRHMLTPFLEEFGGHIGYSVRPSARQRGHASTLLSAALEFGHKQGMRKMMVTVDPSNEASARVIQRAGGILQDVHFCETLQKKVCRYWIDSDMAGNDSKS